MKFHIFKFQCFSLLVISGVVLSGCNSANEMEIQQEINMQKENDELISDSEETSYAMPAVAPSYPEAFLPNAIMKGDVAELKELLDKGADPALWDWTARFGEPAPHPKSEIVKLLVEAGADPDDFENGWNYSKSTPEKRKKAIEKADEGGEAELNGNYETAKNLYLEALSLDPYNYKARNAYRFKYVEGLDAFNQGDYEQARQAWIIAKQLSPGNSNVDLAFRKVEELLKSKSAGAKE